MNSQQLEDRLVNFSVDIIDLSYKIHLNQAGCHLSNQLVRSATSVPLNYAEALAAESRKDYIHKVKISLKELRESFVCLKIIQRARLIEKSKEFDYLMDETNQLISIFVATLKKLQSNLRN